RPTLRDVVSFATHDLTKDPPFSRMHLVSCRNVLIYLTSAAQRRVLELLHFALEPGGHLFLSTSESTGPQRDLFTAISKRHRVYRKVGVSPPIAVARSRSRPPIEREGAPVSPLRRRSARGGSDLARRSVMQ